ncbi:MAG TPA: hypothetical protein VMC83_13510 [Streptosporangiaceae bacterium]|nr:hypothetical protein [Streptosporangiaceae bacterium]
MPTEELENALRSVLARAAADIQDPAQARQRLLHRDYRPGRGHRKLGAGITAATAAAGVVLGLGLTGAFGQAAVSGTGTIRTTAFTLVKHANGTVTLTIHPSVLLEPGTLQRDLQQDGIPAKVTTGSFCSSDPAPAGFNQVVNAVVPGLKGTPMTVNPTLTINPAAMPTGTELSFGYFQLSSGQETVAGLIDTSSYTCTSTAPASPPPGASAVEIHSTGGS